jgi:hypothetical protein
MTGDDDKGTGVLSSVVRRYLSPLLYDKRTKVLSRHVIAINNPQGVILNVFCCNKSLLYQYNIKCLPLLLLFGA